MSKHIRRIRDVSTWESFKICHFFYHDMDNCDKESNEYQLRDSISTDIDFVIFDLRKDVIIVQGVPQSFHRVFLCTNDSGSYKDVGWVLFSDISYCMICASDFSDPTSLITKEHCYACGNVICSSCCSCDTIVEEISNCDIVTVCCLCNYGQYHINAIMNNTYGSSVIIEEEFDEMSWKNMKNLQIISPLASGSGELDDTESIGLTPTFFQTDNERKKLIDDFHPFLRKECPSLPSSPLNRMHSKKNVSVKQKRKSRTFLMDPIKRIQQLTDSKKSLNYKAYGKVGYCEILPKYVLKVSYSRLNDMLTPSSSSGAYKGASLLLTAEDRQQLEQKEAEAKDNQVDGVVYVNLCVADEVCYDPDLTKRLNKTTETEIYSSPQKKSILQFPTMFTPSTSVAGTSTLQRNRSSSFQQMERRNSIESKSGPSLNPSPTSSSSSSVSSLFCMIFSRFTANYNNSPIFDCTINPHLLEDASQSSKIWKELILQLFVGLSLEFPLFYFLSCEILNDEVYLDPSSAATGSLLSVKKGGYHISIPSDKAMTKLRYCYTTFHDSLSLMNHLSFVTSSLDTEGDEEDDRILTIDSNDLSISSSIKSVKNTSEIIRFNNESFILQTLFQFLSFLRHSEEKINFPFLPSTDTPSNLCTVRSRSRSRSGSTSITSPSSSRRLNDIVISEKHPNAIVIMEQLLKKEEEEKEKEEAGASSVYQRSGLTIDRPSVTRQSSELQQQTPELSELSQNSNHRVTFPSAFLPSLKKSTSASSLHSATSSTSANRSLASSHYSTASNLTLPSLNKKLLKEQEQKQREEEKEKKMKSRKERRSTLASFFHFPGSGHHGEKSGIRIPKKPFSSLSKKGDRENVDPATMMNNGNGDHSPISSRDTVLMDALSLDSMTDDQLRKYAKKDHAILIGWQILLYNHDMSIQGLLLSCFLPFFPSFILVRMFSYMVIFFRMLFCSDCLTSFYYHRPLSNSRLFYNFTDWFTFFSS
jgi:putative lipoic acid-binding regulatory protein